MKIKSVINYFIALIILGACSTPTTNNPANETNQGDSTKKGQITTIALIGFNGSYVTSDQGLTDKDNGVLISNRPTIGDWEKIKMHDLGNNKIALQASNGKFVCADQTNNGYLIANRDAPGEWETFSLIELENQKFALMASNGMYVSADLGRTDKMLGVLVANRAEIHDWEKFTIVKNPQ
jgi:hypothetical protein